MVLHFAFVSFDTLKTDALKDSRLHHYSVLQGLWFSNEDDKRSFLLDNLLYPLEIPRNIVTSGIQSILLTETKILVFKNMLERTTWILEN
jgi:hypothetical protein